MLSTAVPGAPAIATPPEVFEEIFQVSANLGQPVPQDGLRIANKQ
jgi:hypothetical protein